jgi:hypothetical protein
MTATKKKVRAHVTTSITIVCLFIVTGCVRNPSKSPLKARDKAVTIPASLDIDFGVESEQVVGKDIKSGMAYKPATFLFGDSTENSSLVAQHEEYEDIPLPIGVIDVQYKIGQGPAPLPKNSPKNTQQGATSHADWCATDWCAQGQCTGDSALYYSVGQSVEQLINFYVCNMERLGWQLTADFYAHETVLFFDRYDKRCAIFLSPAMAKSGILKSGWLDKRGDRSKQATHVTIFVSLRTALL